MRLVVWGAADSAFEGGVEGWVEGVFGESSSS